MGDKNCFLLYKTIFLTSSKDKIYDIGNPKCCIFASVKTNGRCETSFHHLLLIQIKLESLI